MTAPRTIEVTEEQVLYFRARRGHLAGPGAPSAAAAAREMVGAQSQQLPPSLLALSQRTRSRPTAAALKRQLLSNPPRLVRTWGQRDTLHLYDPASDWALVVAARELWATGGRGGPMPPEAALRKTLAVMKRADGPVTRSHVIDIAPRSFLRAIEERARMAGMDARRLAAGRLIWLLAHRGEVCVGDKMGTEQAYATRSAWFPTLAWEPMEPLDAASELTRRYLAVYGPATTADIAHFFNARVTSVRQWLVTLDGELAPVRCGDRKGLVALSDDSATLWTKAPAAASKWPLRLLPLWDSMLMGHADKTWTVPHEPDRKAVWRKGAFVAAVVLARGRAVATWSHTARRGRLAVKVDPLSGWSTSKHATGVRREAEAVAAHLGSPGLR